MLENLLKKKAADLTVGETLGLSIAFTAIAMLPFVAPIVVGVIKDKKEENRRR